MTPVLNLTEPVKYQHSRSNTIIDVGRYGGIEGGRERRRGKRMIRRRERERIKIEEREERKKHNYIQRTINWSSFRFLPTATPEARRSWKGVFLILNEMIPNLEYHT